MTCLGCQAHTSAVLDAYEDGSPCPYCKLSAAATLEIQTIRRARADDELKGKLEQAIRERDEAQRERDWAKQRLAHVESELTGLGERIRRPLSDEPGSAW
jgi:FtsZ-binding cell division protein ZapB